MRSRYSIQDTKLSLFKLKRAKGELLSDVSFEELSPEKKAELHRDACHIHFKTNLRVRRVKRGRRKVWRFIDKN